MEEVNATFLWQCFGNNRLTKSKEPWGKDHLRQKQDTMPVDVWTAQLLMRVFSVFYFVIEVKELKQTERLKAASRHRGHSDKTILTKPRPRHWERRLEDAGFAHTFITSIQTKDPLEPDSHWAPPHFLWKGRKKEIKTFVMVWNPLAAQSLIKTQTDLHKMTWKSVHMWVSYKQNTGLTDLRKTTNSSLYTSDD